MTIAFGVTGSRHGATHRQLITLEFFLEHFREVYDGDLIFHHGCCTGVDTESSLLAHKYGYHVVGHPPLKDTYLSLFYHADELREPKNYLDRDHDIVDESWKLFVLPKNDTVDLRSGTWATARYSVKRNKYPAVIWPNGSITKYRGK